MVSANKYLLTRCQWITWKKNSCVPSQEGHWGSREPEGREPPPWGETVSCVRLVSLWPRGLKPSKVLDIVINTYVRRQMTVGITELINSLFRASYSVDTRAVTFRRQSSNCDSYKGIKGTIIMKNIRN